MQNDNGDSVGEGGSMNPPHKGAKQGNVRQDANYVSKIDPARVAAFLAQFGKPPVANRAAYNASQAYPHPRKPTDHSISQDMPLAPTVYGFADRNAVDGWFEKAFDTPV